MTIEITYYNSDGEMLSSLDVEPCSLAHKQVTLSVSDEISWPELVVFLINNLPSFGYVVDQNTLDRMSDVVYNRGVPDGFIDKDDHFYELAVLDKKLQQQYDHYEAHIAALRTEYEAKLKRCKNRKGK